MNLNRSQYLADNQKMEVRTSQLSKKYNEQGLDQCNQGYSWASQKADKAPTTGIPRFTYI